MSITTTQATRTTVVNGAALASFLAAAIGGFSLGVIVILHETGLFSAPALYGPAGSVSGRTTLATLTWLVGWAVLHRRWQDREIETRWIQLLIWLFIGIGLLLIFPPVWDLI